MASSSERIEQLDIGGLNTRFFGLDFNIESEAELCLLMGILTPAASEIPPTRFLLLSSAMAHELRHFHDWLLCPATADAFLTRLLAAVQCVNLLPTLLREATAVPVPISAWYRLQGQERDRYLAQVNRAIVAQGRSKLSVAPFPDPKPIDLVVSHGVRMATGGARSIIADVIPTIARQQSRVDYTLSGIEFAGGTIAPLHLFEATALLTQLNHSNRILGKDSVDILMELFFNLSARYRSTLEYMSIGEGGGSGRVRIISPTRVSLVVMFAMVTDVFTKRFGSMLTTFLMASAASRQGKLDEALDANATGTDVIHLLESLLYGPDAEPHTLEALSAGADPASGLVAAYHPMLAVLEGKSRDHVADFIASFGKARNAVVTAFLRSPRRYSAPHSYLDMAQALPKPLIRISGPVTETLTAEQASRVVGGDFVLLDDGSFVGYPGRATLGGPALFNIESLVEVGRLLEVGDVLMSESSQPIGFGLSKLEERIGEGKTLLNVIAPRPSVFPSISEGGLFYNR